MDFLSFEGYEVFDGFSPLCTFSCNRRCYLIASDPDGSTGIGMITWTPFSGATVKNIQPPGIAGKVAGNLIIRHYNDCSLYPFEGEHYNISTSESGDLRISRRKKQYNMLSRYKKASRIFNFIFTVLVAFIYAFIYTHGTAMMWLRQQFPLVKTEVIRLTIYILQTVGAGVYAFLLRRRGGIVFMLPGAFLPVGIVSVVLLSAASLKYAICAVVLAAFLLAVFLIPGLVSAFKVSGGSLRKYLVTCAFVHTLLPLTMFLIATQTVGFTNLPKSTVAGNVMSAHVTMTEDELDAVEYHFKGSLWLLKEDKWSLLSDEEKLEVLKNVCDYECMVRMGCMSVDVTSKEIENAGILGQYNSQNRAIEINSHVLSTYSVRDTLEVLLHESRHVYQSDVACALIELEKELDSDQLGYVVFEYARRMETDFLTYDDGRERFEDYYSQTVEEDSRDYAVMRIDTYYNQYF